MYDFLDADCVFGTLISNNIFSLKVWKNTLGEKLSYNVLFDLAGSARRVGFIIYIREGRHCIGITALLNTAKRFNIDLGNILVKCIV